MSGQDINATLQDIVRAINALNQTLSDNLAVPPVRGSATYNPPSLVSGASATTTISITGAIMGRFALASFSLDLQGITLSAYVSAAGTVTCVFFNGTAGTLDLASGTLAAIVIG